MYGAEWCLHRVEGWLHGVEDWLHGVVVPIVGSQWRRYFVLPTCQLISPEYKYQCFSTKNLYLGIISMPIDGNVILL